MTGGQEPVLFDIRACGARPGPEHLNTGPIQRAIESAHQAGGGTVYCPAGTFVTGTLRLKSRVNLHLEAGCTLLASPRREDYQDPSGVAESDAFGFENVSDAHLIIGYQVEDAAITGFGSIDGNSRAFLPLSGPKWDRKAFAWRPGQLIYFCRSDRIRVEGVSLLNAPYWTLFFHGCRDVRVNRLRIENPPETPNGDGIDIDCCRNILVSDCLVDSGDDCLTIRAHARPLGAHALACENVVVRNCVLSSPCNAVRVGVGAGEIRNCLISGLVIQHSRTGLNLFSCYGDFEPPGAAIRGLRFSDLVIEAEMPFMFTTGRRGQAPVEDLVLSNISARASRASYFGGRSGNPIRGLTLENIIYTLDGGRETPPLSLAEFELRREAESGLAAGGLPVGLVFWDVEDLAVDRLRFRPGRGEGRWDHLIYGRNLDRIRLTGCELAGRFSPAPGAAIRLADCRRTAVIGCAAGPEADPFLAVEGAGPPEPVTMIGNDLSRCRQPITGAPAAG
ncbi:MAG TPA: glycosyl hydrolase family 28 protein [bacterium]|nr:glycosyl hydrolase family 28 protein [bacterium]